MPGKVQIQLKECLEKKGRSRYWLARTAGIKYQIVDNYYKNKVQRFDGYLLAKMCDHLHCGIEDLLVYLPESPGKG